MTLEEELRATLNRHCAENRSNTPDFILAEYMLNCLRAFEMASLRREEWYGIRNAPNDPAAKVQP